jgi:hypothetical protein
VIDRDILRWNRDVLYGKEIKIEEEPMQIVEEKG